MRFKSLIYFYLALAAMLIVMETAGYSNLKLILYSSLEDQLHRRAEFLALQLDNPKNSDRAQAIINEYGMTDDGYAWILDKHARIIAFPERQDAINPYFRERERFESNEKASLKGMPAFEAGAGADHRLVYSELLNSRDFLVVSTTLAPTDRILATFKMYTFYTGLALLVGMFVIYALLANIVTKPVYALQQYARSLLVGEYIEKAESLKEPDTVMVASVLERLYNQARGERFDDENPLSGLPGNKSLYDTLFLCIESQKPLAVGFVDANSFTAFRNRYGVDKANSVIRFMGVIVMNAVTEMGASSDKAYHLGNDRFMFISSPDRVRGICEKIIKDFDNQIVYFYDDEDRQKGYILSADKEGRAGEFPYMPICIGIATNIQRPLSHPVQIGHIVGEIRNFLRARRRSTYLIDRRSTEREAEFTGLMAPFTKEDVESVRKQVEKLEHGDQPLHEDQIESATEEWEAPAEVAGENETESKDGSLQERPETEKQAPGGETQDRKTNVEPEPVKERQSTPEESPAPDSGELQKQANEITTAAPQAAAGDSQPGTAETEPPAERRDGPV